MDKTVTFSVGTNGPESKVEQTFTLEELNIESNLSNEVIEKKVNELFKIWVWNTISHSITIDNIHSSNDK